MKKVSKVLLAMLTLVSVLVMKANMVCAADGVSDTVRISVCFGNYTCESGGEFSVTSNWEYVDGTSVSRRSVNGKDVFVDYSGLEDYSIVEDEVINRYELSWDLLANQTQIALRKEGTIKTTQIEVYQTCDIYGQTESEWYNRNITN